MSATSTSTTAEKQVDVSCYDFLYMEMVDYIVRSSKSNDQVFQTLEQLGFRVGQRLAERCSATPFIIFFLFFLFVPPPH